MRARALAAACLTVASGCLSSKATPRAERMPPERAPAIAWRPAERGDLLGYFESLAVEGEAAASLWRVYYHFADDDSYTGAALVGPFDAPRFQTLEGTWRLDAGGLVLDGGEPVQALSSDPLLRLDTPGGSLVLRRVQL